MIVTFLLFLFDFFLFFSGILINLFVTDLSLYCRSNAYIST